MLLWLALVAFAEEPVPAPGTEALAEEADGLTSGRRRIEAAVSMYLAGETAIARRILQAVIADGAGLSAVDRQDALAWLADIQFNEQGIAAAQSAMASLLAENPNYAMDPLTHPPEFCDAFERLRLDVVARPVAKRPPFPWVLGLPLGVGYFIDGKPARGIVFGGLQAGAIAVNIVTNVRLWNIGTGDDIGINSLSGKEFRRLRIWNDASVIGGYSAWVIPFAVESVSWGTRRPERKLTLGVGLGNVALSGEF